ncbi:putative kinase [Actinophytocola algeriensis]|uniref:Putative kinase n=1 Tax=Actinophytocola algeriensis TaxID=1768010 RepID=A0A7W7QAT1_9PSEU|nr:putative kinase [Actinophytocola algeriensis]MBE1475721.1 putative kinase [Actinophytocola algeriensis]
MGASVVVDAVSPVPAARAGWLELARASGTSVRLIEVVVSDPAEHRRRVEARRSDVTGLVVPTWRQVTAVAYEPWDAGRDGPRLVVANDGSPDDAMVRVRAYLSKI